MRLRDRLAQLSSPAGAGVRGSGAVCDQPAHAPPPHALDMPGDERAARIAQLRQLIGEVAAREGRTRARSAGGDSSRARATPSLPLGELQTSPHGALRVVERWFEPRHCHGRVPVRDALRIDPAHVAALAHDRTLAGVRLRDLLILDTETTGLSGGTGTVPFLIGLAWFEGGDDDLAQPGGEPVLRVEQLFLENLGQEPPLLHRLAERLARASVLVSYNGKAFDWPLLRTRFVLARIPVPALPVHLDLLHCARRLWSARLPNVRLTEVERSVLGLWRQDDVDGSQIPGLYHGYLRGDDPRGILPVLQHNEHDLVALAAMLARMACVYGDGEVGHPSELYACALLALRARDPERAVRYAQRAVEEAEDATLRVRALLLAGRLYARAGDRGRAIECYERVIEVGSEAGSGSRVLHARTTTSTSTSTAMAATEHTAAAHLALSRLHERGRDLPRAYAHARASEPAESPLAHGRRLGRLRRRFLDAR